MVTNFLADPEGYNNKKRPGRPSKITSRHLRSLFNKASKGNLSSSELQKTISILVTPMRVRQL